MPNNRTNIDEIIDLTTSVYYPVRTVRDTSIVIDLVNDSFGNRRNNYTEHIRINTKKPKEHEGCSNETGEKTKKLKSKKVGQCSICWDELGQKPLASTKCGHVYCLTCLQSSLKTNKHCPICRCLLKGPSAYHPLYLELE